MQTIKQSIITIIVCVAVVAGVSLVYSWTGPPYGGVCSDPPCPPGGNVPAPININTTAQTISGSKTLNIGSGGTGSLGINGALTVAGLGVFNNSVGIGTASPSNKLNVIDSATAITYPLALESQYGTAADIVGAGIKFQRTSTRPWAEIVGQQQNANDYNYGKLKFGTRTSDALGVETKMTILANGNVGIGTVSPGTNKLQVNGKIQAIGGDICTDQGGGKCLSTTGGAGGLTGSGSTNYISKWTDSTSLGNSIIYDNGTNVGIGTASPSGNARVTISSPNFSTAALYWGVGESPIGFLGVRDGNTALIGTYAFANDLIFRAGGNDRLIIKNDNSIGWYNTSNSQVGFLGYNGTDALVGANAAVGGSLRLRTGNVDRMIINSGGGINLNGNNISNGYVQYGLYGIAMWTADCNTGGVSSIYSTTPPFDGSGNCPSGFTRKATGLRRETSGTCYQIYTCMKN